MATRSVGAIRVLVGNTKAGGCYVGQEEAECLECSGKLRFTLEDLAKQRSVRCAHGHSGQLHNKGGGASNVSRSLSDLEKRIKKLASSRRRHVQIERLRVMAERARSGRCGWSADLRPAAQSWTATAASPCGVDVTLRHRCRRSCSLRAATGVRTLRTNWWHRTPCAHARWSCSCRRCAPGSSPTTKRCRSTSG